MNYIQPVILGAIQGLTEFLPVSSSGHLILIPTLLGWDLKGLDFDVFLHFGSLIALLLYFYKDWYKMFKSMVSDIYTGKIISFATQKSETRFLTFIIIATFPVVIAAFLFDSLLESAIRKPLYVAICMLAVSFYMLFANYKEKVVKNIVSRDLSFKNILYISLSQILALIPGTSRSGITISTGFLLNLSKEDATKVSFYLATPIVFLASIVKINDLFKSNALFDLYYISGFVSSFIFSILAISFMLKIIKRYGLIPFVIYRVLLSLFIIYYLSF